MKVSPSQHSQNNPKPAANGTYNTNDKINNILFLSEATNSAEMVGAGLHVKNDSNQSFKFAAESGVDQIKS